MDRQAKTNPLSNDQQIPLLAPPPRRMPLSFSLNDVRMLKSESHAIRFSVRCSGYEPKEIPLLFNIDAGQWSNIIQGKKHFPHERRNEFMNFLGNEILLIYAVESRGYDWNSLRAHQTELEARTEAAERRAAEAERKFEMALEIIRETRK